MKRTTIYIGMVFFLLIPATTFANAKEEVGISKTEILLGATVPQTGAAAPYFQDFFKGAKAYFDYLNSKGGIQGRKIRLILKDDRFLPTQAVNQVANLLLRDKVFALFNSTPSTPGHLAMIKSLNINQRQIPNLAVTESFSDFSDSAKYPSTFQAKSNNRQEFAVLLHYLEKTLGSTSFSASYPNDDTGSDFEAIQLISSKKLGRQIFGGNSGCPVMPYNRNDIGVISLWKFHCGAAYSPLVTSDLYPLIVRGDSVSSSAAAFQLASTNSKNIYANFHMPLHTDLQDPFIEFFTNVFKEFVPNLDFSLEIQVNNSSKSVFNYVSQQMYEGANSAYVVSQAIAALGSQPTRAGLIAFLRGNSKSLSSAAFSPIDYSANSNIGNTVQYIAKYDGTRWVKVSDYYRVSPDGTSIQTVLPLRNPLLRDGLPSAKVSGQLITEITCKKGKVATKVKGANLKCPKGFKKV